MRRASPEGCWEQAETLFDYDFLRLGFLALLEGDGQDAVGQSGLHP